MAKWSAVLQKAAVSVTCSLEAGGPRWRLTRESGVVRGWRGIGNQCWTCGQVVASEVVRRAYMVLEGEGGQTAFALLSAEAVELVAERFAGVVCPGGQGPSSSRPESEAYRLWMNSVEMMFEWIRRGAFSGGEGCRCKVGSVCGKCCETEPALRLFVCPDEDWGVFPWGIEHWFSGVSDAVMCGGPRWSACQCWSVQSVEGFDVDWKGLMSSEVLG